MSTGTLAPGRPNEHVLAGLEGSWEAATVRGTLHNEGWGAELGYPGIELDDQAGEVEGFLFTSSRLPDHWETLDRFEGGAYERVLTRVSVEGGRTTDAFIYSLRSG